MSGVRSPKIYKNPSREREMKPDTGRYTPQYQQMGITPKQVGSGGVSGAGPVMIVRGGVTEDNNPRTRPPSIRQDYAEKPEEALNGHVPNVGNSMEHSWSGVDGEIIDDLSLNPDTPMVDNNDFVDVEKIQTIQEPLMQGGGYMTADELEALQEETQEEVQDIKSADLDSVLLVDEGDYILIVGDAIVQTGSLEQVQQTAASLVFGEHELCQGNAVPVENVVVLKRVNIKVGLFLE